MRSAPAPAPPAPNRPTSRSARRPLPAPTRATSPATAGALAIGRAAASARPRRRKRADTLVFRQIPTRHRHFDDLAPRPTRAGEDFRLERVPPRAAARLPHEIQRIHAESALAVGDAQPALQPHEQVAHPPPR